ncbi:uncharacterized protein [Typha latifolia]|uniref:uncharacterized protein n=1 Tax=Typha latifolia TaxID=4733 RepID=UPI003C3020D3
MGAIQISASKAMALHSLSILSLATGYLVARDVYSLSLVTHPAQTLRLLLVFEAPIIIGVYSWLRRDQDHCSFLMAVGRGLVGLPIGAFINAFGAIVLGAPVGIEYWPATTYWSFLMSLFTFTPAACAFGPSRMDWHHILVFSNLANDVDWMISVSACGAIIGAWLGAWPMPLDWERPWQEWPICVTYGAITGHFVGMAASWVLILLLRRQVHPKAD